MSNHLKESLSSVPSRPSLNRRKLDVEGRFQFLSNPLFGTLKYQLSTESKQKISSELPILLVESDAFFQHIEESVALYFWIDKNKENLKWTRKQRQPIKNAIKAANALIRSLDRLDTNAIAWFDSGRHQIRYIELKTKCMCISSMLESYEKSLPEYTSSHQSNFPALAMTKKLLNPWQELTGKTANRSKNKGGFIRFIYVVCEQSHINLSVDQVVTAFRSIQGKRLKGTLRDE
jgi:hypothetical protein